MAKKVRKARKRTSRKKKSTKRKVVRPRKAPSKKKKPAAKKKAAPKLPAEPIGRVTHYFPKAKATAVVIEREGICVGDVLYFKGHTTRFKQKVESLQIDRRSVPEASPGEEVGIQVRSRTREHDWVFKL